MSGSSRSARARYYILHKPAGVVCTNGPETRPRAIDLVTDPRKGRIATVGRLDEESKGLLLLTSDGEFAERIGIRATASRSLPREGPRTHPTTRS